MSASIPRRQRPPSLGGSKTPNAPPPALGGSIAPAQTNVGDPHCRRQPGRAVFRPQPIVGSNIGIPYARCIRPAPARLWGFPLADPTPCSAGFAPSAAERNMMGLGRPAIAPRAPKSPPRRSKRWSPRPTTCAPPSWPSSSADAPLRRRASGVLPTFTMLTLATRSPASTRTRARSGGNSLYDYGFQLAINSGYAPGVPGTERFQKLCSFEYLQRYFTNVLCNKGINLGTALDADGRQLNPSGGNEVMAVGHDSVSSTRPRRRATRSAPPLPTLVPMADQVGPEIGSALQGARHAQHARPVHALGHGGGRRRPRRR